MGSKFVVRDSVSTEELQMILEARHFASTSYQIYLDYLADRNTTPLACDMAVIKLVSLRHRILGLKLSNIEKREALAQIDFYLFLIQGDNDGTNIL